MIQTKRLILRRWRAEDRELFALLNQDPRVMEFMPGLLSRQQSDHLVDRIEEHFGHHGYGLFATELALERRFIGFIGLQIPGFDAPFRPCVEIGWRLAADVWGRGLATEGATAAARYAFEKVGLDEIVSFTAAINARSLRVMQKIGMTHDSADDFDHPRIPAGHPLRPHVLYRLSRAEWRDVPDV